MKLEIEVPDYSVEQGVMRTWDEGSRIAVVSYGTEVLIRANSAGLITLARHCLILAQHSVPEGFHFQYEVSSDHLETGSVDLVIERDDFQSVE
ncbi:MAG: hypothetical protein M3441_13100 [Chloroflexota bacterium]|nr:hypothetical protein [Chloroflexota bacterium]